MSSSFGNNATSNRSSTPDPHRPAPMVVRQLKPPPEIWELVHPVTTQKFKPARSFLSRPSSWMILVFVAFIVGVVAGIGIAFWKNPAAKAFLTSFQKQTQVTEEKQAVPVTTTQQQPSVATSNETSNVSAAPTPEVSTSESPAPVETAPSAPVIGEQTQLANSAKPEPTTTKKVLTNRQTRISSDEAAGVKVGSPAAANNQRPVASDPGRGAERTNPNPASTKPKGNTAENSQVLTPVKQPSPSKAKVIQWP